MLSNGLKSITLVFALLILNNPLQAQNTPDFSDFPPHVCEYLTENYDCALEIEQNKGIPVAVTLGIACFESGYGLSFRAMAHNSHFGFNGDFQYNSAAESFNAFADLMHKDRYKEALFLPLWDLKSWVKSIQSSGYNPKKSYVKRLLKVIRYINRNGRLTKHYEERLKTYIRL